MSALHVAPASFAAARFACSRWHYAQQMPAGRLLRYGCWYDDEFYGAILYGRGSTHRIGAPFDLRQTQICELVRVALRDGHPFPVSRALAITLREVRRTNPGLRLIVSFADTRQGHYGGIYQATNWIYLGAQPGGPYYRIHGREVHSMNLHSRYGTGGTSIPWLRAHVDPGAERFIVPPKHKYVYPLDSAMRKRLLPLAKSYPRAGRLDGEAPAAQAGEGGSIPTPALEDRRAVA